MSAVSGSETEQALAAPVVKPPLAVPRRLLRMRSDAALAERFAAGDEAAFDVIYERHRPVVLAVCMGVLGTPPDAEDATQETFSALAVALRTRPPAELRPWLIRVARNASIDTTRRRRHRLLTLDGEIPEVAARPHGSGQAELAVVLDGIRELPEGQRMALLMRELGGHSYSEIAEFLATDEEAVKGLIARARVGLRTYREATELSCSAARSTIAAEPDGRRYDKTIRRHLRGCASCRGYREALRDDAKALRAALPIQAGTVATGSLSGGMLSAAKGSLIGYGLTQAATTCAASACAVGAIGGMVFVAPVHRLGLPPILPVTTVVHRHAATRAPAKHAAPSAHTTVLTVSHPESVSSAPVATSQKQASATHTATAVHHRRRHVTFVALPDLPRHHAHPAAGKKSAPTNAANPTGSAGSGSDPGQTPSGDGSSATQVNASQVTAPAYQGGNAQAENSQAAQSASTQSSQSSSSTGAQAGDQNGQTGNSSQGNSHDHGSRWGGNGHHGKPQWTTAAAAATAAAATTAGPAGASTSTATTTSPAGATPTTVTTSPATTQPGNGWSHGWGGSRHGGNWHQGATQGTSTTQSTPITQTSTTAVSTSGNGAAAFHGGGHGHGGWGQQGNPGSQGSSATSTSGTQSSWSAQSGGSSQWSWGG